MDTNQTENKQAVNMFVRGMNSDTAYTMVDAQNYVFGQNVRITTNTQFGQDISASTNENSITSIPNPKQCEHTGDTIEGQIMATASLENIHAVITKRNGKWELYRVVINHDTDVANVKRLFYVEDDNISDAFSLTMNKELEDQIKLYIATGNDPILLVNMFSDEFTGQKIDKHSIMSNNVYPTNKIKIVKTIQGKLKTQQVQYTYRLYKKYGVSSKLAPLTNKIQIINRVKKKAEGCEEDSNTAMGLRLQVSVLNNDQFDRIQVFRISYIKPNQEPEINLIFDTNLQSISENIQSFNFDDTGVDSLAEYSYDEFQAINGQFIIPESIEQNQGILFAANVKDNTVFTVDYNKYNPRAYQCDGTYRHYKMYHNTDTSYEGTPQTVLTKDNLSQFTQDYTLNKYADMSVGDDVENPCKFGFFDNNLLYGGNGPNISWKFVTCKIPLDTNIYGKALVTETDDVNNNRLYYIDEHGSLIQSSNQISQYFSDCGVPTDSQLLYTDMFTSSLFRSLRRNEVYRYGIVFYDKNGTRSDALWIADIKTPDVNEFDSTELVRDGNTNKLYARPIGIEFTVKKPNIPGHEIIAYEIVRCEKTNDYTKNLLQVALSRPIRNGKYNSDKYRTPYYPNVLLTTQFMYTLYYKELFQIPSGGEDDTRNLWKDAYFKMKSGNNVENHDLFQMFSPEINYARTDVCTKLQDSSLELLPEYYVDSFYFEPTNPAGTIAYTYTEGDTIQTCLENWYNNKINSSANQASLLSETSDSIDDEYDMILPYRGQTMGNPNWPTYISSLDSDTNTHKINEGVLLFNKYRLNGYGTKDTKLSHSVVFKDYIKWYFMKTQNTSWRGAITDVKNLMRKDTSIRVEQVEDVQSPTWDQGFTNVKLDGSSITNVTKGYKSYITSVGSLMYVNWYCNGMYDLPAIGTEARNVFGENDTLKCVFQSDNHKRADDAEGWVGPGPVCLLAHIENNKSGNTVLNYQVDANPSSKCFTRPGTIIANLTHSTTQFAGLSNSQKQFDQYYGFGNVFAFNADDEVKGIVFDGEIYITPAEIVNAFKTYDFNDNQTSVPSGQVVYFIPLESTVNTYFDYGMNYKNTSSDNIQLEPGAISGVATADRAAYQYNQIYSQNETSISQFISQSMEDQVEIFPQRIYYSMQKQNGESIDNWLIFKPIDFIDADTRYGNITHLMSLNTTLYYWQTTAFGKLSVNERSLVTDTNNNTIQLGQGGVLQRTDYLNTMYGMLKGDHSAISAEGSVFWIDRTNKTVVSFAERVGNLCETLNVNNINNKYIDWSKKPYINYDMQNNELLCKYLNTGESRLSQLIFSLKLGVATTICTRQYDVLLNSNNVLYGLLEGEFVKFNHLTANDISYMPIKISFIVNKLPQYVKVFDNQKIITANTDVDADTYMDNKKFYFETDYMNSSTEMIDDNIITDREGNIQFAIPRMNNSEYGDRMRGKWLRVTYEDNHPESGCNISNVITTFRISYS